MKFFGRATSIGKLDIDQTTASSESPEIQKRLSRITDNYDRLDQILTDLEVRIQTDQRLKSTFALEIDPESTTVDPKKPR